MEEHHLFIFQKVEKLMLLDPADLLPRHHLLLEGDFTELGTGPTLHQQCWIASMESAMEANVHVQSGGQVYGNLGRLYGSGNLRWH